MENEFSTSPNLNPKRATHHDAYRRIAHRMELELSRSPHRFFIFKMLDADRAAALLRGAPTGMSVGWPADVGRAPLLVIASRALPGRPSMLDAVSKPTQAILDAVRAEGNVAGFMMQMAAGDPELMEAAAKWIIDRIPAIRPPIRVEPVWSRKAAGLAVDAARAALGRRSISSAAMTMPGVTRH
ncbi:hypothetical protein FJ937_08365 [Mesorhizobium sp. B2-4-4]|uniref:hypothetical protein n=1 Tax=Mesorhizobium sp. B2-4-4 TaxID=2589945 RepID=UPI00112D8523|nr:hypothetical protein [Mesorhizobium sp. B2-4-4]TPL53358.1 hypothetical protein FJ937_08365 [Mesorhizobium sp. B2-4-4]